MIYNGDIVGCVGCKTKYRICVFLLKLTQDFAKTPFVKIGGTNFDRKTEDHFGSGTHQLMNHGLFIRG
jgi:hypothetical protein